MGDKGGVPFNLSIHMNYLPKVRRGKLVIKERKKNLRRREIEKARALWKEYASLTAFIFKL
jgi:hypothetical protein